MAQLPGPGFTLSHPSTEKKNMSLLSVVLGKGKSSEQQGTDLQPGYAHFEDMIKGPHDPQPEQWEETADWLSAWHVQL